jgi:Tol biopolymer transport system component
MTRVLTSTVASVIAVLAGSALLIPAIAHATLPGANGQIVYAEETPDPDLFVVSPDGSRRVNVGQKPFIEQSPAWSPDGSEIAFAGSPDQPHPFELYVMNADGTNRRQLTDLPGLSLAPTWSPDGSHIVFLYDQNNDGATDIYTMARDGSQLARVTSLSIGYMAPRWSPTGDRILFSDETAPNDYDLYTVRPDGSDRRPVATLPGTSETDPDWSPDGKRIVYSVETGFTAALHTMRADGTGIVDLHVSGDNPVWSPDGTKLAYRAWDFFGGHFFPSIVATVDADGSDRQDLDSKGGISDFPSWQRLATKERDCRRGGWRNYGDRFRSERQCIAFVRATARQECVFIRAALGNQRFRDQYGQGKHLRHAMRSCIAQRSGAE